MRKLVAEISNAQGLVYSIVKAMQASGSFFQLNDALVDIPTPIVHVYISRTASQCLQTITCQASPAPSISPSVLTDDLQH
jgi:hypothetical protein